MKRAVALIAVAVMAIICVIPMMDSSDADGETSISADFFCERDLSTVASTIDVVYYEGGPESEGKIVGSTSVIAAKDSSGFNKFSVTITPGDTLTKSNYYFIIDVEGFSVIKTSSSLSDKPIDVKVRESPTSVVTKKCYQVTLSGTFNSGEDNNIDGTFIMARESLGTITGFAMLDTKEPVYLNNVTVTLYDIASGTSLLTTQTSDNGSYTINYNAGMYGIKFELGGYNTYSQDIVIGQNETTTLNVKLTQSESYFGLDLPHALMVLGGAAAIVLVLFSSYMRMRLSRRR